MRSVLCIWLTLADIVDNQEVHVEGPADEDDPANRDLAPPPEPVPTGRIVGVVRRNWRPYCGMLEAREDMQVPSLLPSNMRRP